MSTTTRSPGPSVRCGRSWPEPSSVRIRNQYSPSVIARNRKCPFSGRARLHICQFAPRSVDTYNWTSTGARVACWARSIWKGIEKSVCRVVMGAGRVSGAGGGPAPMPILLETARARASIPVNDTSRITALLSRSTHILPVFAIQRLDACATGSVDISGSAHSGGGDLRLAGIGAAGRTT